MPIVAHTPLPAYDMLRTRGHDVLPLDAALTQDIRELHIGLLNMMPDAAVKVTEQQYLRLIGAANQIVQFYVHPFSIPGLERGDEIQAYVDQYYAQFEQLKAQGLDALIITGANVANPKLELEPFWEPLEAVVDWAADNVTSILCSCLATHALVKMRHGIDRHRLPRKQWGVYEHRVRDLDHPLMRDVNTRFEMIHSRWNEVRADEMEAAGLRILVDSKEAGVQLAVSPDGLRMVYFQGHPEYFTNSLLKEYKRETLRYLSGELDAPPPHPENYFSAESIAIDRAYLSEAMALRSVGRTPPAFPEEQFGVHLDNTWGDTGKAIVNNWLGLIYRLTHHDRRIPFMDGVDPNSPLDNV